MAGLDIRDAISQANPRLAAVAGNHDQWRGQGYLNNVGYTPGLRNTHFRPTYWKRTWQAGELELELYGLDSNAGLAQTKGNWRQRGSLDLSQGGEYDQLAAELQQNWPPNLPADVQYRVRALMVHHSLTSGGGLQSASVTKILELAEAYRFAAVLTGHTHEFKANPHDTLPTKKQKLWELRSASALQGPENRLKPAPGFLAHQIFVDGTHVQWQAWRYVWDASAQSFAILFADLANPFADFTVP